VHYQFFTQFTHATHGKGVLISGNSERLWSDTKL
jgi:hypothetical protein